MNQNQGGKQRIQQISLGLSVQSGKLISAEKACKERQAADLAGLRASLLTSTPQWPYSFHLQACPFPMVVPQKQLNDLKMLHELLSSAITNIVERWWTDEEARFPERMPLESLEEDVLRVSRDKSSFQPIYLNVGSGWMAKPKP